MSNSLTSVAPPTVGVIVPGKDPKQRRIGAARSVPRKSGRRKAAMVCVQVLTLVAVLVIWQLVSVSSIVQNNALPQPLEVGAALVGLWGTSTYWVAIATTLEVWAIGLAICIVIGIPVGLLTGISRAASRSTRWVFDFFRTIPTIAMLPLVLLLFGPSLGMQIVLITLSAIWPLIIQSMYAAKQVEPLLQWVVKVFQLTRWERVRFLWVPSVTPLLMTGMRLAATIALLMTISSEYIGGAAGLGRELMSVEQAFRRPEVFAYTITAGAIGLIINLVLLFVQRRLLWWHPSVRGESA